MDKERSSRRRSRPRKRKGESEIVPKKKRNYKRIALLAFCMAFLGATVGLVKDEKTAITLGIIGLIMGSLGGMAISFGDSLPARRGTEQASQNYHGGNKMADIDDILK